MGIKGIYPEIGPGERVALSKLAVQKFEQTGRPLRIAIDVSIWLFQIQSGKGGTNPALRTFYYRLLRLITLSIHPVFVFDGPNKPPFKRHKRTGPNIASIPEFLAKQLLKHLGLPIHLAPGEAEAECALLQHKGIVDAVLSEDVDTLMFGSALTFRNWSPEGGTAKTPTHVNVYDAHKTKAGSSGLDEEGMILVALMSGGDYTPEGIPGCGPKTACEAARAGFGRDLCTLDVSDKDGIAEWKNRLCHELKTNEGKLFTRKHKALIVPEDFPRTDILRYYTHPCVSRNDRIRALKDSLEWDRPFDIPALRTFTAEAFDWNYVSGAKKFIRNLAPALLVRQLRLWGDGGGFVSDDTYEIAQREAKLVKNIYKAARNHATTDGMTELRLDFSPLSLVPLNLDAEEVDPVEGLDVDVDSEEDMSRAPQADDPDLPNSPKKKRGPSKYDPTELDRAWVMKTYVKVGIPLMVEDWEESFRDAKKYERMKAASRLASKTGHSKSALDRGMPKGALDRFAKVKMPGFPRDANKTNPPDALRLSSLPSTQAVVSDTRSSILATSSTANTGSTEDSHLSAPDSPTRRRFRVPLQLSPTATMRVASPRQISHEAIELFSSPDAQRGAKRRVLRRSCSETLRQRTPQKKEIIDFSGSPTPRPHRRLEPSLSSVEQVLDLPSTVTKRRHRSPLRRAHTVAEESSLEPPTTMAQTLSTSKVLQDRHNPPALALACASSPTPSKRTPRKAINHSNIIEISSSPVTPSGKGTRQPASASPSTPQTQRLITDWLSPSERSNREMSAAKPTVQLKSANAAERLRRKTPSSPSPKSRRRPVSQSRDPFDLTGGNMPVNGQSKQQKEVIRVRESLEGAWKADVTCSINADGAADSRGRKKRGREWRVSQVQVLDLTGG